MTTVSMLDPGQLDQQAVNTVRFLVLDAIQKANIWHFCHHPVSMTMNR